MAFIGSFEIIVIVGIALVWLIPWKLGIKKTSAFTNFQIFLSLFIFLSVIQTLIAIIPLIVAIYYYHKHKKAKEEATYKPVNIGLF